VPTYSTTVRSSSDDIVLDFQVWVEDGCVELCFAVEAVTDALPVGGWLGHCRDSIVHRHTTCMVVVMELWKVRCVEAQVGIMERWRERERATRLAGLGLCRYNITLFACQYFHALDIYTLILHINHGFSIGETKIDDLIFWNIADCDSDAC
jgi:hypothetical protein